MRSMKILIIALGVAISATLGGATMLTKAATAQESAKDVPLVVGTLDWQEISQKSKAGKSLSATLQSRSKAFDQEIGKKEDAIRAERTALEKQKSKLEPADYDAKRKAIDKKFESLRKDAAAKRKELQKARDNGYQQMLKALDVVIRDIADKRGLTLILHRSAVVLGPDAWDITEEVKKALDAKLPSVKI